MLSVDIGDPFLAADLVGQLLVVGAGKKMLIYDLNNPAQVSRVRQRCVYISDLSEERFPSLLSN